MSFLNIVKGVGLSILGFVGPIKALVIAATALVLCDTLSGIFAARERSERITAAKLRRTVTKLLVYTSAIVSGLAAQVLIPDLGFPMAKIIAAAIGVVEIKSVLENVGVITGMSVFKTLLDKLGSSNDKVIAPEMTAKVVNPKVLAWPEPGHDDEGKA